MKEEGKIRRRWAARGGRVVVTGKQTPLTQTRGTSRSETKRKHQPPEAREVIRRGARVKRKSWYEFGKKERLQPSLHSNKRGGSRKGGGGDNNVTEGKKRRQTQEN